MLKKEHATVVMLCSGTPPYARGIQYEEVRYCTRVYRARINYMYSYTYVDYTIELC